jgi:hypothetical protein
MGTLRAFASLAGMVRSNIRGVFLFLVACCVNTPLRAQDTPIDTGEQVPLFSLLNLVKADGPLKVKLGNEPVGIGEMPYGFYTGIVNWYPTMPVTLEAAGLEPAEIPVPEGAKDATTIPFFVIFDAKKPPAPEKEPVPIIEYAKIPPASNRAQNYLDVINLSDKETLEAEVGGTKIVLPKRKRVRVSTQASAAARILPDGPEITVAASEDGGSSQLLAVLYSLPDGKIDYSIASEPSIRR